MMRVVHQFFGRLLQEMSDLAGALAVRFRAREASKKERHGFDCRSGRTRTPPHNESGGAPRRGTELVRNGHACVRSPSARNLDISALWQAGDGGGSLKTPRTSRSGCAVIRAPCANVLPDPLPLCHTYQACASWDTLLYYFNLNCSLGAYGIAGENPVVWDESADSDAGQGRLGAGGCTLCICLLKR